jgi:hypothetical protein
MKWFNDIHGRQVRLTIERREHITVDHPEMFEQIDRIEDTLLNPDKIIRSKMEPQVELFYRYYGTTPVTEKYLCVIVKVSVSDLFIITAHFTDTMRGGETLWERK